MQVQRHLAQMWQLASGRQLTQHFPGQRRQQVLHRHIRQRAVKTLIAGGKCIGHIQHMPISLDLMHCTSQTSGSDRYHLQFNMFTMKPPSFRRCLLVSVRVIEAH